MAQLNAFLNDTLIGRAQVNLADFVVDGKVTRRYQLFGNDGQDAVKPLDNHENIEHMVLDITTGSKGGDARSSSKLPRTANKNTPGDVISNSLKSEVKALDAQVDKLMKDIAEKEHVNNAIDQKLQDMGYTNGPVPANSMMASM
jgi:hypothetical protein